MRSTPLHSGGWLMLGGLAMLGSATGAESVREPTSVVTNIIQLRSLATEDPIDSHVLKLEGDVWWANPTQGRFVLRDSSGAETLEAELSGAPIKYGDRIRLTGRGTIVRRGAELRLGARGAVVENDGIHSMLDVSGAIYLAAGRQSIRLCWFNNTGRSGLRVEYEGPGVARQKIPASVLVRKDAMIAGDGGFVRGLDYKCFEGTWRNLPDFSQLTPVKSGSAAGFDLNNRTRDQQVALEFTGFIDISREGMYRFHLQSDDGSRLFVSEPTLSATVVGGMALPAARAITIGQLLSDNRPGGEWARVEGNVAAVKMEPTGLQMELRAGTRSMRVEVADATGFSSAQLLNRRVRLTGFCQPSFNLDGEIVAGVLLVPGKDQIEDIQALNPTAATTNFNGEPLSLLTRASAVRELPPGEAQKGLPVRIRGVVTCVQPDHRAFVIQDSTVGLYVAASNRPIDLPKVGEFLEVDGATDEPGIARLQEMRRLGEGKMPEPGHPTWDQLLNGSQDSQWVEIGGLVEGLTNRATGWTRLLLRTRAGVLKVDLRQAGVRPGPLEQYENAVVRVRGCMFADWMPDRRLKVGQIRMYDVEISVDQSAPADLFSIPRTTVAALKRFDPAFDASRRVKVAGQIVYVREADYFIMDGTNGLRFLARQPLGLEAGDTVEVVGFPELSGAAPVLRAAVARKTGRAELPTPKKLSSDDLIVPTLDSTLVQVEGQLAGIRQTGTNLVLEMQSGSWRYLARLNMSQTASPARLGSRLELTGVYCAQGGYQALGADVAPVDLLLSRPADIRVLAQPPWWTLARLLVAVGVLAVALAVTVLWISQLRRQVEERSAELTVQIQNRQQLEQKRALDQERARIAQDLHDELGSDLVTVGMLAVRAKFATAPEEKRNEYLDQVRGKANEMVAALDEIVWAMNPGHDSLTSLVSYLSGYADRFLGLANIAVKLDSPPPAVNCPVDSRLRHEVFLAFKESLANVVHHSGATEVHLSLQGESKELRLTVVDNGRGLPPGERTGEMDGLANMRARVEKLGGRFEINGQSGRGTSVHFCVPLNGAVHI